MKGAVFDWDGTLVDIDARELYSINHALSKHGLAGIDEAFYIQHYYRRAWEIGTGPRMVIEAALKEIKDPRIVERAYETYRGAFADTVDRAQLQRGAREALVGLKQHGLKLGIATMRFTRSAVAAEVKALGLNPTADVLYTRQDIGARADPLESLEETVKKRSLLVEKTLRFLQLQVSEAFLVGDSWWDIRAGKLLGMRTVLVRTGFSRHNDFTGEKPDITVESLEELAPKLEEKEWI